MVITQIENGKIVTWILVQNGNIKIQIEFILEEDEAIDEDTGIGKVVVIGASNSMTSLINTKCTYSIKILNENVFGVQKCELNNDAYKTLKSLER